MRYSDRRKRELQHRQASGWSERFTPARVAATRDDGQTCIPVRIDHKTIAHVRERNFHKYAAYFGSACEMERHVARFKADPDNFAV
jgi:hypothetical protein